MDDKTLINECLKGNSVAQKKLFDKYAPKMMYVCLRYCREQEDAEDALQEAFIKMFASLERYQFEGSFEGWLRRIVVNCCLDFLRRVKKLQADVSVDDYAYKIATPSLASDQIQAEDLLKLIHALPKGYQTVFNLFAIEGYSHKEIADLLGITEETSKSQYFRARAFLRNSLEKQEVEK